MIDSERDSGGLVTISLLESADSSDSADKGTSLVGEFWRAVQRVLQFVNVFRAVERITKALATLFSSSAKKKPVIPEGEHPPLPRVESTTVQSMSSSGVFESISSSEPRGEGTPSMSRGDQGTDEGWTDISATSLRRGWTETSPISLHTDGLGDQVKKYTADGEKALGDMLEGTAYLWKSKDESPGPQ